MEKYKGGVDVKVLSFDDYTNSKFGVDLGEIPHKKVKAPSSKEVVVGEEQPFSRMIL